MAERVPAPLLGALADLMQWLESAKISAVVVGGVASSFLGRPRLTQDVDALAILPESQGETATEAARKFGIVPRIDQAVDFARRSRVLLLKHAPSDIAIDVILGGLPFEQQARSVLYLYSCTALLSIAQNKQQPSSVHTIGQSREFF